MTNPAKIAWYGKHFGEEPPLVGTSEQGAGPNGAGTIFFSGCNLKCVFCQNYQISQTGLQENTAEKCVARWESCSTFSVEELAEIMLKLQSAGAVNIDLVTPTIWLRTIKEAIILAKKQGLALPIVWNSNAYESVESLRQLEGLVDIYLPDFKYGIDKVGLKYSAVPQYPLIAERAIREMIRQVGNLKFDEQGLATKGVIVRHLILPNNIDNSLEVFKKIADIDQRIYLSLMNQYAPLYRAAEFPELNRLVTANEFEIVQNKRHELGLDNGWDQELGSEEVLVPDFKKKMPFC